MIANVTPEYLAGLVREFVKLPRETEWLEFKVNNSNPKEIGEYVSALSNSAALAGKPSAYLIWGIENESHKIVGTTFDPRATKVGNEEVENWLLRLLNPKIIFRFLDAAVDGHPVVILEMERAYRHPVQFQGDEFIRVGSYKKRLKDFPDKARALYRIFDQTPFELGTAASRVPSDRVLALLDYPAYFELMERPLPEGKEGILNALAADNLIRLSDAGGWDITQLGAVLFAKKLADFHGLTRKAVRVIRYKGNNRVETDKEREGTRGYASGFKNLIEYVNGLLPSNEVIEQALRKTVPMYPEIAVRELVANAMIHQDFYLSGTGPMVEIFDDRMEITNPGVPLVETNRFVDTPPRSRNEALASLMRRIGICEERGSGWDKVVSETESHQLPAPLAEVTDEHTRVVLFAHKPFNKMDKVDRVRAVYLHACLRYVNREYMTNSSVRARFGIEDQNIALASRLIRDTIQAGLVVADDPEAAPKLMRYVPVWAKPRAAPGDA